MSEDRTSMRVVDGLTGLLSAGLFAAALRDILGTHDGARSCSVLVLDVDRMHQFNDRNGFSAGDAMLRHVTSSMQSILPQSALLFRLGSNEFGAILPDTERRRAYELAEEVRDAVARHAFRPYEEEADAHGVGVVSATCSIGLSVYPTDLAILGAALNADGAADPARLLRLSADALRAAKDAGGNAVRAADAIHHGWIAGVQPPLLSCGVRVRIQGTRYTAGRDGVRHSKVP